ncbi:MAG: tryptophanase [Bacteroidales bacterium]|nr:tryptophanase [Bacteroidales bacterium]
MERSYFEPYKTKMTEPVHLSSWAEREEWIRQAKYNLFNLQSDQVMIDLLTDSGTGAMSDRQWAAIMTGDESYAGSSSYEHLKETIREITGFDYFLPTHQGRAAENVLFSVLVKSGDIVPGNSHFDTTKGHIEYRKAQAVDCSVDEAFEINSHFPFKGNVDLAKLEKILKENPPSKIPLVIMTLTCNTTGGQPVSMENLRAVSHLTDKYGVRLFIDGARFAENAWFIRTREPGYENTPIRDIVREMFGYADGMTMSSKKDGLVNIGGFIGFREEELFRQATTFNIMFEGFITYGGMAGRDMNALAVGLKESTTLEYLEARTKQVALLGEMISRYGIPVIRPYGGHAIFVDALHFLFHVPREEFPAQTLAVELYLEAGVRGVEIGALMADRDPVTRKNRFPALETVRLAVPRRVYSDNHMRAVAEGLKQVWERRDIIRHGMRIVREAPILRHFTVELGRVTTPNPEPRTR